MTENNPFDLEQACAEALKRVLEHINRHTGQQLRRMRESWGKQ